MAIVDFKIESVAVKTNRPNNCLSSSEFCLDLIFWFVFDQAKMNVEKTKKATFSKSET
jgi:hypothetical protein